ncbi:MAG TPA: LysM peptidoglycan-binding domain-containing protein, partial [Actinomycetes bacterium]|nr:LysM peptidoglycan-binding domain-containing protein [Actinomycetes bacterium]
RREPPSYRFPAAGDQPAREPSREPSREPGREPGGEPGREPGGETRRQQPYEVKPGDNLWSIARKELTRARSGGAGEPTNREVAEYWLRLIEVNRNRLRSGDPDLIYPREPIILPPVD